MEEMPSLPGPTEPEAPRPPRGAGPPIFAWWGWVLLVVLVAFLIWYLANP